MSTPGRSSRRRPATSATHTKSLPAVDAGNFTADHQPSDTSLPLSASRSFMKRITLIILALILLASGLAVMKTARAQRAGDENDRSSQGHQITALIAYSLLTPRAQKNVPAILEGKQIIDVSTWPDQIKNAGKGCVIPGAADCKPEYRPETSQWHFVDIPFDKDKFDPQADYWRTTRYGDCIIPAIEGFRDTLNGSPRRAVHANGDHQQR